jgi:hypothetical protein
MNMQVLDAHRDTTGGYKVDVSRGERIGRVASEWFSRPDDERYLSLSLGIPYEIEDTGKPWAAAMDCPCGCGNTLHINLLPDTRPVWSLKMESGGAPTLAPSVWRREGCGSHFILRNGHIRWV